MEDKVLGSRFEVQGGLAAEVEEFYLGDGLAEELAAEAGEFFGGVGGVALEGGGSGGGWMGGVDGALDGDGGCAGGVDDLGVRAEFAEGGLRWPGR